MGASDLVASPLSEGNHQLCLTYIKQRRWAQEGKRLESFLSGIPHDPV